MWGWQPVSPIPQYDQQFLEKTSVDAHGLSSCLGCSRILWHLISFQDHHRDSNMTHHVKSCHMMSHHLTSCHIMWHHFTSCHIMSHHTTWCHTTTDCSASLQIAAMCTKPSMKCNEVPEWSWMLFQPMHAYHAQHAQVPIRAMRDAEQISSRSLRERVLDICWSSLRS